MAGKGYAAFESSVILQGSKTKSGKLTVNGAFESSVILQGSKTTSADGKTYFMFESSVILQGSKTKDPQMIYQKRLRVV